MLDRKRIGARLKGLRVEQGLDQVEVARRAAISPGTLQTIEWGARENKLSNIEAVARVLGTTLDALERKPEINPGDPLLAGLNREDLEIARLYHDAASTVRTQARSLLRARDPREPPEAALAEAEALVALIAKKPQAAREAIDHLLHQIDDADDANTG